MPDNNTSTYTNRPRREAPRSALRTARLAKGLSQVDLAFASGVSMSWISVLERRPGLMTERVAERLSSALEVSAQDLCQ